METRTLTRVSFLGALLFASFALLSSVLYLEVITLCIVLYALTLSRKEAVLSTFVFTMVNMAFYGITPWTIAYVLVFVSYAMLTSMLRPFLQHRIYAIALWTMVLAFSTGMLLDLPFLLFSSKVTTLYLLLGVKTSIIQGVSAAIQVLVLFEPLQRILERIERKST
ncbi:MAG: hypothetical protein ACRDBX_07305 [Erysipelotrichaceae bacterium]